MTRRTTYASVGVDAVLADRGVDALVDVLGTIDPGRPPYSSISSGHYASVLRLSEEISLALSTDGVGSKAIVAELLDEFRSIGIDCIAMNVNDVICVGARPLALLDYLSVAEVDEGMLEQIGEGLKEGAERAGIEIPGGEVAQLPEMIQQHSASGHAFDLVGTCVGLVSSKRLIDGRRVEPGDVILGLPSTGVHANGLTLARAALPDLHERPPELRGKPVGTTLLEPTGIYVRAVMELLDSGVDVRGLAHITSKSFRNLLRLSEEVGFSIEAPLPTPDVFPLIQERANVPSAEMWEVFNMGCGFCCVVPPRDAENAAETLSRRHPGTAMVGRVTEAAGIVEIPSVGLVGTPGEPFHEVS